MPVGAVAGPLVADLPISSRIPARPGRQRRRHPLRHRAHGHRHPDRDALLLVAGAGAAGALSGRLGSGRPVREVIKTFLSSPG
ncbi:hypothetical protein [Streptomyces lavendulae]|uniref:hypothetical protein n=1 Tax=Streptomyces lavendulae TaxID=1914 RepID=UPI0031EAB3CE